MRRKNNLIVLIVSIVAILVPCIPLFLPATDFYDYWPVHIWMINYQAQFFKVHHSFAPVFNTIDAVGIAFPIYYGYLFFPTLGLLSFIITKTYTAVRLAAVAVYAVQYLLTYLFLRRTTQNALFSCSVAIALVWSIYPMTNLYSRSDIPEFFAAGSLFCAVVLLLFALRADAFKLRLLLGNLSILSLTFTLGSHPITALYGAIAFTAIVIVSLYGSGRSIKSLAVAVWAPLMTGIICILPWFWAVIKCSRRINMDFAHVWAPGTLGEKLARLAPYPIDGYPYLDLQMSLPLLLLFLYCAFSSITKARRGNSRLVYSVVAFAVLALISFIASVDSTLIEVVGWPFKTVQFTFRIISYINLFLFSGILLFALVARPRFNQRVCLVICTICLTLAAIGVPGKLFHAFALARHSTHTDYFMGMKGVLVSPPDFHSMNDFLVPNAYPACKASTDKRLVFRPGLGRDLGSVDAARMTVGDRQPVCTNIYLFPWNKITIAPDRQTTSPKQSPGSLELFACQDKLAVAAPANSLLHYSFSPDPVWAILNSIALPLFEVWLVVSVISVVMFFARSRSGPNQLADTPRAPPPAVGVGIDGSTTRLRIVDFVRFMSILAVLAVHLRMTRFCTSCTALEGSVWDACSQSGFLGVYIFFVVSGFIISRTTAMCNKGDLFAVSPREFYVKRAARIVPLLAATVLLGVLFFSFDHTASERLQFTFRAPNVVYGSLFWLSLFSCAFNWLVVAYGWFGLFWTVFWSLAVEEQFYLIFPWAMRFLRSNRALVAICGFLIVLGPLSNAGFVRFFPSLPFALTHNSFGCFGLLAIGVLLHLSDQRFRERLIRTPLLSAGMLCSGATIIVATFVFFDMKNHWHVVFGQTLLGLGTFLFLLGGLQFTVLQKVPRWAVLPGELSYGCYLVHSLVLYLGWNLFKGLDTFVALGLFTFITTIVAAVSYSFLENPANRLVKRLACSLESKPMQLPQTFVES